MKSCSILISNYNSYEAIQLCIESIRKYTRYPHEIIVYDDASTNGMDIAYLNEARKKGWIRPIFGGERVNHGRAINALLNYCQTDLAMILDNDIQILQPGWLTLMVEAVEADTLIISGLEKDYKSSRPSYPDWFQTWFMMLNMKAYRDGMEVDWNRTTEGGRMIPVGAKLHIKLKEDNPKGYKLITPIPWHIIDKFYHIAHVSSIATYDLSDTPDFIRARKRKFGRIKQELAQLRGE